MNQNYDQQIFGEVIEVIHQQPSCQSKNKSDPAQLSLTQSARSEQNYSNSSLKSDRFKIQQKNKKLPDALTNYTDSQSIYKSGCEIRGLRNKKPIENCSSSNTNTIKQVKIKKLTKNDNFYCSCNQKQEYYGECIVCHGNGYTDGNNHMAKFIQYIMEFKLRNKQVYQNQNTYKIQTVTNQKLQHSKNIEQQRKKLIKSNNQQPTPDKKLKKSISLIRRTPSLTPSSQSSQPINQFCSQFIKNQALNPTQPQSSSPTYLNISQNLTFSNCIFNRLTSSINNSKNLQVQGQKQPKQMQNNSNYSQCAKYQYGCGNDQQKNISTLEVGFNNMSKSVINDSFGNRLSQSQNRQQNNLQPRKITNRQSIGTQYYGYNKSSSNQQLNTRSILLKSCIAPSIGRQSINSSSCVNITQLKQKLSIQNIYHYGFGCDNCQVSPIIGLRYHCNSFMCNNDYDLCQQCYKKIGHKHRMQQIGNKNVQKICQKLEQFSSKSIKSTTRLSVGTKNIENYGSIRNNQSSDQYKMIFKSSIH